MQVCIHEKIMRLVLVKNSCSPQMFQCFDCCKLIPEDDILLGHFIQKKYEVDDETSKILDSQPTLQTSLMGIFMNAIKHRELRIKVRQNKFLKMLIEKNEFL